MRSVLPVARYDWTFNTGGTSAGVPTINPNDPLMIVVRGHGGAAGTIYGVDAMTWFNANVIQPLRLKYPSLVILDVIFLVCYAGVSIQSPNAPALQVSGNVYGPLKKLVDGGPGDMHVETYGNHFDLKKIFSNKRYSQLTQYGFV